MIPTQTTRWLALSGVALLAVFGGLRPFRSSIGTGQPPNVLPGTGCFHDVTASVGLAFRYDNDATPQRRFIETTGGGCAFLDYDNDGYLDVFAVQSGPAPGSPPRPRPHHALYHNLAGQRFEDVTG